MGCVGVNLLTFSFDLLYSVIGLLLCSVDKFIECHDIIENFIVFKIPQQALLATAVVVAVVAAVVILRLGR